MQITHYQSYYISRIEVISVKMILDTDELKERLKELPERLAIINDMIDDKITTAVGKLVDLLG
jgi:hypothetical protein